MESCDEEKRLVRFLEAYSMKTIISDIMAVDESEQSNREEIEKKRKIASSLFRMGVHKYPNATYKLIGNVLESDSRKKVVKFLSQLVVADTHWSSLQETTRLQVRSQLLEALQKEEDEKIQDVMVRAVVYIAESCLPNQWTEVFPIVFQSINSDSISKQRFGLSVIHAYSQTLPDLLVQHIDQIHSVFVNTLASPNISIQMHSLDAMTVFLFAMTDDSKYQQHLPKLRDLIPLISPALDVCIDSGQNNNLMICLMKYLTDQSSLAGFLGFSPCLEIKIKLSNLLFSTSQAEISQIMLFSPDIKTFENLIARTLSDDDDDRWAAEDHLALLKKNYPSQVVYRLSLCLLYSTDSRIKIKVVKILYRNLSGIWQGLEPTLRSELKEQLLTCTIQCPDKNVLGCLHILMKKFLTDVNLGWPELPGVVMKWADSDSAHDKQIALGLVPLITSDNILAEIPPPDSLNRVFLNCLSHVEPLNVRVTALSASLRFIKRLCSVRQQKMFINLIPKQMHVLKDASKLGELPMLQTGLSFILDFAKTHSAFLNTQNHIVVETMLHFAENINFEASRVKAAETLILLAEGGFLLQSTQQSRLVGVLLTMLYEELCPALHIADDGIDDYCVKEVKDAFLTRLASSSSLCNGRITKVGIGQLFFYFTSTEWQKRYSAVTAVYRMSNGLRMGNLNKVVTLLLDAVRDDNARIKIVAIDCIKQLFQSLGPEFKETFGEMIVQVLNTAMNDYGDARIQKHAQQALQEFQK